MVKPRVSIDPVRGFRDILPPESEELTQLAQIFTKIAKAHGYHEVKPPTLERFELFALKSGEEIKRTMYVFRDKSGRELALRPEATASIARIYIRHLRARPKPLRLFYIVNCFRYENPQHARYREFWQAGIELLGDESLAADFEAIKILVKFYDKIGMINHIKLKIGTTETYRLLFTKHGIPEETQDLILHFMDKREYNRALEVVRAKEETKELQDVLKSLWDNPHAINEAIDVLRTHDPSAAKSLEKLKTLIELLKNYKPALEIEPDVSFARGLAYYTGIIFEVQAPGFPVSIAGGGRYDNLIELYGGERVPSTGFAIGLDRTLLAAKELGIALRLDKEHKDVEVAIIVLSQNILPYAAQIQDHLTSINIPSTIHVERRIHKLIPQLLEQNYTHILVIGEREYNKKTVTIKDLRTKVQKEIKVDNLRDYFTI